MSISRARQTSMWAFTCTIIIAGVLAGVSSLEEDAELMPVPKRSAMDLAMMQVYGICDGDKNGVFAKRELQCVQRVLFILLTGR